MQKDIFSVKDKVIIITGGAGFLGRRYAETLVSNGARVVVFDIKTKALSKNILEMDVDITNRKRVTGAVREIFDKFKRIDVLINNAALRTENFYLQFEDFPLEEWEMVMKVNLTGMFLMSQAVVPIMKRQKSGSIINISSIYGLVGPDFRIYGKTGMTTPAVYSASKAGVIGLTKYLATYLGEYHIRVNAITPGGVFNNQPEEFVKNYSKKTPLGRMAEAKDLEGAIIFLSSDASSYVTGHNLVVDGGWTAW